MSCSNTGNNIQLANLCACQAASNALAIEATQYTKDYATYTANQALYNTAYSVYQKNLTTWQNKYNSIKAGYQNQRVDGTCAAAGNCDASNCPDGYVNDGSYTGGIGSHSNCPICFFSLCGTTGCKANCMWNSTNVDNFMATWVKNNPQPQPPVKVPDFSELPPTGNNILCCSQLFSGITADSVNFNNITQNCNQTIQQQINALTTPVPTTPVPTITVPVPTITVPVTPIPISTTPPQSTTTQQSSLISYLFIGVVILILLFIIFL